MVSEAPYLPIESGGCIVGEEPVLGPELGQLDAAEVAAVRCGGCWDCQQRVRQLEEVCVTAPEFVPVDLRGVPLEGGDGHIRTCLQDGASSAEIQNKKYSEVTLSSVSAS